MTTALKIKDVFVGTLAVDVNRSRLSLGGREVSFHCDKFNTRVVKGMEDIAGVGEAHRLLSHQAEKSHYDLLTGFFANSGAGETFQSLKPEERLATIFDIYKILAYGSFHAVSVSPETGVVTSPSSYLAEGWLENMSRWDWKLRQEPLCHDACGHIAAAYSLAFDKDVGSYTVRETECRAKGDPQCSFVVEVK